MWFFFSSAVSHTHDQQRVTIAMMMILLFDSFVVFDLIDDDSSIPVTQQNAKVVKREGV